MTFTATDYTKLISDLKSVENIGKIRYGVETVESLPGERKDPLKFLFYIMDCIAKDVAERTKARPAKSSTEMANYYNEVTCILYAATQLAAAHIRANLAMYSRGSKTADNLEAVIKTSKASNADLKSYFKLLNKFFNGIYINNDSKRGINSEEPHPFIEFLDLTFLESLIGLSYQLEAQYHEAAIATFTPEGEAYTLAVSSSFSSSRAYKDLVSSITWKSLCEGLAKVKEQEFAAKGVFEIDLLGDARRVQLNYLETLKENLEATYKKESDHPDKIAIFLGAMLIVREQIKRGKYSFQGSVVSEELAKINGVKGLTDQQTELLVLTASGYTHLITTTHNSHFRSEHPFSKLPVATIPNPIADILNLAQDMIKECRQTALKHAFKIHNTAKKDTAPASGVLSSIFGLFAALPTLAAPAKRATEDKKADEADAHSATTAAGVGTR